MSLSVLSYTSARQDDEGYCQTCRWRNVDRCGVRWVDVRNPAPGGVAFRKSATNLGVVVNVENDCEEWQRKRSRLPYILSAATGAGLLELARWLL